MPRSRSSDTLKTRKDMVSITDTDPFILTFESEFNFEQTLCFYYFSKIL